MTFGQLIAKLRKEKNLQLKDLAALIKREDGQSVSYQYISDLEHGRRPAPSNHLLDEFAHALDVSRQFLYLKVNRLPPDFDAPDDEAVANAAYEALCKRAKPRATGKGETRIKAKAA